MRLPKIPRRQTAYVVGATRLAASAAFTKFAPRVIYLCDFACTGQATHFSPQRRKVPHFAVH